jgi:Pumilio-family RNA binding repeat
MSADYSRASAAEAVGEYNRPRRPDTDTITYLRGLPLDLKTSTEEIKAFLDGGDGNGEGTATTTEYPQSLAAALSAIQEVRQEIASLAGDEFGSQCLELLTHVAAPYSETAARILLAGCAGYHLHLATHRYGSHVVQTILQLAVSSSNDQDLALHDEAPQFDETVLMEVPALNDLVLDMVNELAPHTSALAIHVCGSHVLRTLLCVLGGVNLVASTPGGSGGGTVNDGTMADPSANLRGRKKNKKKKKRPDSAAASADLAPHAGTMRVVYCPNSRLAKNNGLSGALNALTESLVGGKKPAHQSGELQERACHSSAGPLLIVLLRVLTYASDSAQKEWGKQQNQSDDHYASSLVEKSRLGVSIKEPHYELDSPAHRMVCCLLCWQDDTDDEEQKVAADIIYNLAGDQRGSHLLETMFRLSPDSVYDAIVKLGDFANPTSMKNYVEHDTSNFVIQTLLCTVRSKERAETMLKTVEQVISSGLAIDPAKKRRGILWRSVELAATYRVGQEAILKAIRLGFGSLVAFSKDEPNANDEENGDKKKKKRKKASDVNIEDCIPHLVGARKPEQEGGRIPLDATGCRTVYHLLRFTPRLCQDILNGIVQGLEPDVLQLIAKDGLGSRCIMDGILDGPIQTPNFAMAVKGLLEQLTGCWISLATDRVAHHLVKKVFVALPKITDKSKLVEELGEGYNRLSGNAMGRSVIEACMLNEYLEDKKNWRRLVSKQQNTPKDRDALEGVIPSTNAGTPTTDDSKNLHLVAAGCTQDKSKRKRKRKKANDNTEDNENEEEDRQSRPRKEENKERKSQKSKILSLESIMNAMSIPKDKMKR